MKRESLPAEAAAATVHAPSGTHVLADLSGIAAEKLSNCATLEQLLRDAAEGVPAVDDAVRPGRERRAAVVRAQVVGVERHDEVTPLVPQHPQAGTDARDHELVAVPRERELPA